MRGTRERRAAPLLGALLVCLQDAPPSEAPVPAEDAAAAAGPAGPPPYEARYHARAEGRALLESWARALPERCRFLEFPGLSAGEAETEGLLALELAAPGRVPPGERPTVFLVGAPDGLSLSGVEAVLAIARVLLAAELPPELAFVAIPWAAPQALERTLVGRAFDGRDATPSDDDGDGRVDEDGPDDLDGDGLVLEMLVPDPEGAWTLAADRRTLVRARPGDGARYRRVPEGLDDDGDGRWNEDPVGGVVLDRSFPLGWETRATDGGPPDPRAGPFPLATPQARALAGLLLARRTAAVLVFQASHGSCAAPGGGERPWPAGADAADHELVTRLFAKATGRAQARAATLAELHGEERPGTLVDWAYGVLGAWAYEIAPWGPAVEAGTREVSPSSAAFAPAARLESLPLAEELERAWSRWLDNTQGGIGFVDWHPVDLGDGRQALVGGWEPFSRANPSPKSLPAALAGLPDFVLAFAAALPRLELRAGEIARDGDLCELRARVANTGRLSAAPWTAGRSRAAGGGLVGARVSLSLPPGARLLAGELEVRLGSLAGGMTSRELTWAVLAPPGSLLELRARAPFCSAPMLELRP